MKTQYRRARQTLAALAVAVTAVATTSCIEGDEPVITEPEGGPLFERYVSLGNSITAGFQSGGILVDMQEQAYPVLLAEKADAPFGIPALTPPGCPPPLVGPLTTQRTSTDVECALRSFDAPDVVQNLGVPGADAGNFTDPLGTGTILNTLILGGRTQLRAMQDADPTLVSVWLGNNDALGAALSGDTTTLTSIDAFQSEYGEIVSAVLATDAQDAVLIGVLNPMTVAPALQPGAYFWAIAQNPPPGLPTLDVSANCAPFDAVGNPNPGGARLVSFVYVAGLIAAGADPIVIDCAPDAPGLLNETEMLTIATRIAAFNAYIEQQASANAWIYIDPRPAFVIPALADPDRVRKCQDLATATDAASFQAAVLSSCPVDLDPGTEQTFFGSYISFDGIHPSAEFQAVFADTLADRLNAAHGLSLPVN